VLKFEFAMSARSFIVKQPGQRQHPRGRNVDMALVQAGKDQSAKIQNIRKVLNI